MKVFCTRLSVWLGISFFLFLSCKSSSKKDQKAESIQEAPKPIMDAKTDSLKNYLDAERQRRKPN